MDTSTAGFTHAVLVQKRLDRMKDRADLRKAQKNELKQVRAETENSAEQTDVFLIEFKRQQNSIEAALAKAETDFSNGTLAAGCATIECLDSITELMERLKRYMTESTMFLTAFDNEHAKIEFQQITNAFNRSKALLIPKKKFNFANKKPAAAGDADRTINKNGDTIASKYSEEQIEVKPPIQLGPNECGFTDRQHTSLQLASDESNGRDLILARLSSCVVFVAGHPGAIQIHNLTGCTLIIGPTAGSIYMEECTDCKFIVACQQLRVHTTTQSDFYIHVTSKAIIEYCSKLRFAPYPVQFYENGGFYKDFVACGMNTKINNWDDVDDFCHLARSEHSPNWTVIPTGDRISTFPSH